MRNNELLRAAISGSEIPKNWLYCFNSQCQQRERCVRYISGTVPPNDRTWGQAVFPASSDNHACPHFKLLRLICTAWGFDKLFDEVKVKDAPKIRKLMKDMLGGNGSYYRFMHGERRLTPEQQASVKRLFSQFGYNDADFDFFREEIDFT